MEKDNQFMGLIHKDYLQTRDSLGEKKQNRLEKREAKGD